MKIIKNEGFKDIFFGLAKDEKSECYFLIYSKTGNPDISIRQEDKIVYSGFRNIELLHIPTNIYSSLLIPFKPVIKFITVKDEQEYDRFVSIFKELL